MLCRLLAQAPNGQLALRRRHGTRLSCSAQQDTPKTAPTYIRWHATRHDTEIAYRHEVRG